MSEFYYVKCLGDGSWLSTLGTGDKGHIFRMNVREALALKESEANALGFKKDDSLYPLIACTAMELNHALLDARKAIKHGSRGDVERALVRLEAVTTVWLERGEEPQSHIIRVYMDGGVIQQVHGIPDNTVVRTIDLDVEGSDDDETRPLDGDDLQFWDDDPARPIRACIGEWTSDGRAVRK